MRNKVYFRLQNGKILLRNSHYLNFGLKIVSLVGKIFLVINLNDYFFLFPYLPVLNCFSIKGSLVPPQRLKWKKWNKSIMHQFFQTSFLIFVVVITMFWLLFPLALDLICRVCCFHSCHVLYATRQLDKSSVEIPLIPWKSWIQSHR